MKKEVSPGLVALALAGLAVVLGVLFWWNASPARQSQDINKAIEGTAMKSPPKIGDRPGPDVSGK